MVSVNPGPTQGFPFFDPMSVGLTGFNSLSRTAVAAAPGAVGFDGGNIPITGRSSMVSFVDDPTKKIRKPYTIRKSRESWTEVEHDKFLEALQLFDRDWKKIEAFVGSKTAIQIRSHAQKYFLKVQKSGTNEHLPPPRPKRKALHPYPQKAPKRVAHFPSSSPLLEPGYLYSTDSQQLRQNQDVNDRVSSCSRTYPTITSNCCDSSSSPEDKQMTQTDTEPKLSREMPNFAEVYRFIASVFDPNGGDDEMQRLKQMDPINMEAALLLMGNLCGNLTSPEFKELRKLISSCSD